jgi:hypothetical protein
MAAYKITSGQQFGSVVRRMTTMGLHLPDSVVEEGGNWYDAVHHTIKDQTSGSAISEDQGAGIVAAVSPNMDFDNKNINALEEIHSIPKEGWDMIQRSASRRKPDGGAEKRLPEVGAMLKEVAPSLSGAYDRGLVKAQRILNGENWRDVLPLETAPKTHSFADNLSDPRSKRVTIDGRAADIITNSRIDWKTDRGLDSANRPRGRGSYVKGETRYESYERAYAETRDRLSVQDSRFSGITNADMQAIHWVAGKGIERSQPTASGEVRVMGEERKGQPYTSPQGRPLERDSAFWDQK